MAIHAGPSAEAVPLESILELREEYRRAMACQIVHDSWHARGFTTAYLLRLDGRTAGYGAVGGAPRDPRDTVKEFYPSPEFRGSARPLFDALVSASGARAVEAQTNDPFLLPMLREAATTVESEKLLFADGPLTRRAPSGAVFRRLTGAERRDVFAHGHEPVGEYGVESGGRIVATGGLTFHYNPPYADLYMEVDPTHRGRGIGSFLVQELMLGCRAMGYVPAARCDGANVASRRTLERAGMRVCGQILRGRLREPFPDPSAP